MDSIFGKQLYTELEAGEKDVKSYYAFLTEIPSDYRGVESVSLKGDTIIVEEYGLDPARRIDLNIKVNTTGIDEPALSSGPDFRMKNYPNPFSDETIIDYHLSSESHVCIEVFNIKGQPVRMLAISGTAIQSCTSIDNQCIDPEATSETVNLFNNLMELSKNHILFGHQDDPAYGIGWAYEEGKSDCKITTGSYPAVYGWELGGLELGNDKNLDDVPFDTMRKLIIESYLRGGITTISWHEYSPLSGKDSWADTKDTINPTVPAILPGGTHHDVYKEHMDKVAAFLNSLVTTDGTLVPVIFRPLHENTGSWFWWGEKHYTAEEYKSLFQFTVEYLKDECGVHHALYCYSPSGDFNSKEDYLIRYPGDEYVDILGFDQYRIISNEKSGESAIRHMEILAGMAAERNKLYTFSETGDYGLKTDNWFTEHLLPCLDANEQTRGIAYVLVWRNDENQVDHFFTPYEGHKQVADFKKFREQELILFEDDLPMDLYK